MNGPIVVEICHPAEVGALPEHTRWSYPGVALSPRRLWLSAQDRRWETWWAVARQGGDIVGILPMSRHRGRATLGPRFDPRVLAPGQADHAPGDPTELVYIGGFKELLSGFTLSTALGRQEQVEVRRALVTAAFAHARSSSLFPLSIYVREPDDADYRQALGDTVTAVQIRENATIALPQQSFDGYFGSLTRKDRQRVRRELAELARMNISAERVQPHLVLSAGAELIAQTKIRYGGEDHPMLAAMRLNEWLDSGADHYAALVLYGADGSMQGVCFVAAFGDAVESYELGLAVDAPDRHHRYVELAVYAAVRFAVDHDCRRLILGLGASEPKARRGAEITPVWAILPAADAGPGGRP